MAITSHETHTFFDATRQVDDTQRSSVDYGKPNYFDERALLSKLTCAKVSSWIWTEELHIIGQARLFKFIMVPN